MLGQRHVTVSLSKEDWLPVFISALLPLSLSFVSPCRSLRCSREQIILAPSLAKVDMEMTQLTQENTDFAARDRYHHSSPVSREQLMLPY